MLQVEVEVGVEVGVAAWKKSSSNFFQTKVCFNVHTYKGSTLYFI